MDNSDEEIVIERILRGEHALYSKLVEKYKGYAYTLAFNILQNNEDAEEAAQDSFIKAYRNLSKFNRDSKFSTWLYRIVFNTSITHKKRKKIHAGLDHVNVDSGITPQTSMEMEDRRVFIRRAMSKLNEEDRYVMTLFYFKELSLDEIAEITGDKANAIKVRIFRARKKLAEELKLLLNKEMLNLKV